MTAREYLKAEQLIRLGLKIQTKLVQREASMSQRRQRFVDSPAIPVKSFLVPLSEVKVVESRCFLV